MEEGDNFADGFDTLAASLSAKPVRFFVMQLSNWRGSLPTMVHGMDRFLHIRTVFTSVGSAAIDRFVRACLLSRPFLSVDAVEACKMQTRVDSTIGRTVSHYEGLNVKVKMQSVCSFQKNERSLYLVFFFVLCFTVFYPIIKKNARRGAELYYLL